MGKFEKNSKWAFALALIAYLAFKVYVAVSLMEEAFVDVAGSVPEEMGMIRNFSIVGGIIGTVVFVVATYFIYRAIYRNINRDNPEMLERFQGIYFSNMTMLYIGSIVALVISSFVLKNQVLLPSVIGIVIKLFLILGINFILIDGENSRMVPNMATLGVLALF